MIIKTSVLNLALELSHFFDIGADVPLKGSDVKYVTLNDLDEVVELLKSLEDEDVEIDDEPEDPDNEFQRYVHGEISSRSTE